MNDNEQSKREELEKQKNQLLNDLINVNNQLEKGNNKSTIISIIFFFNTISYIFIRHSIHYRQLHLQ